MPAGIIACRIATLTFQNGDVESIPAAPADSLRSSYSKSRAQPAGMLKPLTPVSICKMLNAPERVAYFQRQSNYPNSLSIWALLCTAEGAKRNFGGFRTASRRPLVFFRSRFEGLGFSQTARWP